MKLHLRASLAANFCFEVEGNKREHRNYCSIDSNHFRRLPRRNRKNDERVERRHREVMPHGSH